MHTRLIGRHGGVAKRYTHMLLGGSPRIHIKFRVPGEALRHSRILTVSTGLLEWCHFFVLPN